MSIAKWLLAKKLGGGSPFPPVIKRVTGNPIEFSDGADAPLVKCVTQITGSQDLHGQDKPWVGGAGKNKFDPESTSDLWVLQDGTQTHNPAVKTVTRPVSAGENVTLSNKNNSSSSNILLLVFYDSSNNLLLRLPMVTGAKYISGTAPENTSYVLASFYTWSLSDEQQLEIGVSYPTEYAPYSNICPITAYTDGEIEERGKNILPLTVANAKANNTTGTWNGNVYSINNGTIELLTDIDGCVNGVKINGTFNANIFFALAYNLSFEQSSYVLDGVNITPDQTNIQQYARNETRSSDIYPRDSGSGTTITLLSTDKYSIYLRIQGGVAISNKVVFPMLRFATSTDTTYEPYTGTTHTTTYPSAIYRGSEDVVNGEVTSEWKKIVFDGTEAWRLSSSGAVNKIFELTISDLKGNDSSAERKNGIIASFIPVSSGTSIGSTMDDKSMLKNNGILYVRNTDCENTTDFATWINGCEFAYEILTPTTSSVTPTNLPIKSLSGYNHIESSTGEMVVDYITEGYQNFVDTVESALPNTTRNLLSANKGGTKAMDIFLSLEKRDDKEEEVKEETKDDMR